MMDTFAGVMVDSQDELTVQSLLSLPESSAMGLSGELMAQAAFIQGPPTEITLDEDDVFQCGKCKKVFTSFQLFMFHKKKHQLPGLALPLEDDLDGTVLAEPQIPQQSNEDTQSHNEKGPTGLHFTSLEDDGFGELPSDIGPPILLETQDPLSFSIDEGVLNINATQLPEGSFVSSSLTTLPSVSETIKSHERATSDTSTTWLLTKQDDNLNLVATSYADERTLFLDDEQKVVGISSNKSSDKVHTELEFTSDDLLSEVPFASEKEVFLGASSITAQETITGDPESRVILPSGEYMLKSGIDYISSGGLLTGFDKVDQQALVTEEQSNETVSVGVLEVEMSSIQNNLELSAESLETASLDNFSDECSSPETDKKKKRPRAKKTTKTSKSADILHGGRLKCAYCSKRFSKNFDLQQHQRSHTGEKPFQCVVCGRAFAQKSNVKKHMKTHKVWPKSMETLPKVMVHEVSKSKTSDESDKKTEDDADAADETSTAKKGPEYIIDNSYTCQYCDASHDSYFALKTHLKTHLSQKVYWCNQQTCMKMFPDLDTFLEHTQIHIEREACYRCHVCRHTFKTLGDLGIHQYTHSAKEKPAAKAPGERYKCQRCRSRFVTPENLEHHLATASHHHPCPEPDCKRVFTCERNLRRHLMIHSTTYPYTCKECGKSFRTENYLNLHSVMHSNERPFVCKHCPAAFNRKDRLSRHLLIHEAVKKYKCPFHSHLNCSREFNRQDKLKLHILTHLTHANKAMQCQGCKKDFRRMSLLRKHEKKCLNKAFRRSVKRRENAQVEANAETPAEITCPETSQPQAHNYAEKLQRKQAKKTANKRETSKTVTFKVGPSKSHSNKKRKNLLEIAAADANLQTPNSNENVPTIEIIVMPLSLNVRSEDMDESMEGGVLNETGMYRVMFPADGAEYPVDLSTGNEPLLSRVDCEREGGVTLISSSDQEVTVFSANAGIQKL